MSWLGKKKTPQAKDGEKIRLLTMQVSRHGSSITGEKEQVEALKKELTRHHEGKRLRENKRLTLTRSPNQGADLDTILRELEDICVDTEEDEKKNRIKNCMGQLDAAIGILEGIKRDLRCLE